MSDPTGYIIETILPKHEVHLLGGPSGAGKTRWLLRLLTNWQEGDLILGHISHPVPWLYVAADRSMLSVRRTLEGMQINHKEIPTIPAWDKNMKWFEILDAIEKKKEELVVVESYGSFIDHPTSSCVKAHINETMRMLQRTGKTLIGVVESPKMKPYERYENPRQRISGAAAWSHFSETIFLVEPDASDPTSPARMLHVCPRNAPMQAYPMAFDSFGDLIPRSDSAIKKSKNIDSPFKNPNLM